MICVYFDGASRSERGGPREPRLAPHAMTSFSPLKTQHPGAKFTLTLVECTQMFGPIGVNSSVPNQHQPLKHAQAMSQLQLHHQEKYWSLLLRGFRLGRNSTNDLLHLLFPPKKRREDGSRAVPALPLSCLGRN